MKIVIIDGETSTLTQLHNSTIEWNRDRTDLNFTDRELMDKINSLLFDGKSSSDILTHLEKL